jgi:hypothetical protein
VNKYKKVREEIISSINTLNTLAQAVIGRSILQEDDEYTYTEEIFRDMYQYHQIREALYSYKELLKSPTEKDVCEALKKFNNHEWIFINNKFKSEDGNIIDDVIFNNYYITEIPPDLLILIGRFYLERAE